MSIESMQFDPEAQFLSDADVVNKINSAVGATITRAECVDPEARPLVDGEVVTEKLADGNVTNPKLMAGVAKANLDAIGIEDRGYVNTNPEIGEHKVVSLQRASSGDLDVDYVVEAET